MFWCFGCKASGILAPPPGIEPAPPVLEGKVLTTGPPGKSPDVLNRPETSGVFVVCLTFPSQVLLGDLAVPVWADL